MIKYKRQLGIAAGISLLIIALSQCTGADPADVGETEFAARETCVRCHKNVTDQYESTAHFHTSAPVFADMIEPTLANRDFHFSENLRVVVEDRGGKFFQVTYENGKQIEAKSFDVAIGSGEKARTFGYWGEEALFQLPLTHYTKINRWVNSPGFTGDRPNYARAIIGGCLECHSSFAKTKTVKDGNFSVREDVIKGSIAYGIDCQRCHGPAAKHVAFHQANPEEKTVGFLVKIKTLSRQQRIDNCAVCHSGNDEATQLSLFNFLPGDTLKNFYYPYNNVVSEPDVHGNQYQMLAESACFIKSNMDCSSCHNTHKTEKNNPVLYSQRCMNCHNATEHPMKETLGATLKQNCIDCHMPVLQSKVISFQESGELKKVPYSLRSHKIGVYTDKTRKIISYLKAL